MPGRGRKVAPPLPNIGATFRLVEKYNLVPAVLLNAVPFHYDRKNRKFTVTFSSVKFGMWLLSMLILMGIEWIQMMRELFRAKMDDTVSRGDWCLILFICLSWNAVGFVHFNALVNGEVMANHLNQIIRMRQWFTDAKLPASKDHKIAKALLWACFFQGFFQCLTVAIEGTKNQYLYSLVPVEYRSGVTGTVWALFAYYRVITNFLVCFVHYFPSVLQVETCTQVLGWRKMKGRTLEERLKGYRMLQILSSRYDEAYGSIFIPVLTNFNTTNTIAAIYGMVKLYDKMEFAQFMNFPLMVSIMLIQLITFYPKNASVYEATSDEGRDALVMGLLEGADMTMYSTRASVNSTERILENVDAIRTYRSAGIPRELFGLKRTRMIARSCPIIGIPFGRLYKIKRSTVLSLFDFIACSAVSMLITYP